MAINDDTQDIQHRTHVDVLALLYETAFNRVPDDGGLNSFDDALDVGATASNVADAFVASPEFAATYGDSSQADIIASFYQNVLNRQPEPGAVEYWSQFSVAEALVGISQSREAQAVQADGLHGFENAVSMDMTGGGNGQLSAYIEPPQVVEVPVPGPTVIVDAPDNTITLNSALRAPFSNANGDQFAGDGTSPADAFNTNTAQVGDGNTITVGLDVLPRQTDTAFGGGEYLARNVSFDGTTLNVTHVAPAGPQDTDNGSFQDLATRGANNQGLLVATEGFTFAEAINDGYVFEFRADTDRTNGVAHATFTAVVDPTTGSLDFVNAAGQGFRDFKGGDHVASETFQQNFVLAGGVAELTEGSQFSNELNVYAPDGHLVTALHETLILGTPGYSPADQFI